jgi:hypothetical protein
MAMGSAGSFYSDESMYLFIYLMVFSVTSSAISPPITTDHLAFIFHEYSMQCGGCLFLLLLFLFLFFFQICISFVVEKSELWLCNSREFWMLMSMLTILLSAEYFRPSVSLQQTLLISRSGSKTEWKWNLFYFMHWHAAAMRS